MWATFFIAAVSFCYAQRFFDSVFIKIIQDSINAFAIKTRVDHLLLGP
jgi:hypothetical protein